MKKTLGLVAGVVLLGAQGCFGMRPLQNPLPSNPTLLRALVRAVHAEGELKIREQGVAAADGGGVGEEGGGIAPPPQRLPGTALPTPTRGILAAESACAIALRAQIAALGNAIDASKFETAIDYRGGVQPALLTFVKHHKSFSKRDGLYQEAEILDSSSIYDLYGGFLKAISVGIEKGRDAAIAVMEAGNFTPHLAITGGTMDKRDAILLAMLLLSEIAECREPSKRGSNISDKPPRAYSVAAGDKRNYVLVKQFVALWGKALEWLQ